MSNKNNNEENQYKILQLDSKMNLITTMLFSSNQQLDQI